MKDVSIEMLEQLIILDDKTGFMWWRYRPRSLFNSDKEFRRWNTRYAGTRALSSLSDRGYLTGTIMGTRVSAHRIVYALHHREWPENGIDHVNGDKTDNRPVNLRDVTQTLNSKNARMRKDNTSGATGVVRSGNSWTARIDVDGERKYLGCFATKDKAIEARSIAQSLEQFSDRHGVKEEA